MTVTATPRLHSNGTSGEDLREGYMRVLEVVEDAIRAMRQIAPHGRDYYVQPGDALHRAREEHRVRVDRLLELKADIETLAESVVKQDAQREASRALARAAPRRGMGV